jgi:hypothetical protein
MEQVKLTEKEKELIEAIRNFKKAKHNYSNELYYYVVRLLEELLFD